MYVKTLSLRGFKSFASATSMRFEPGITCVVGPNGSGKSNVVDAFSWVMGEQGAKSLRGGKMEDVVFAGTSGRPALGRAEVSLTIDNSDGALPIDYAEVTISRLLFRSGQSEYSINGDHCRLLDVQELLSDSGLGREMHVIVGQGQLDEVINSGPETRRALIEEAAGVLKHRRRKEKALRKLDAMQANLTRLVDLTSELGRRLKPLGRQAQIARKAAVIQADLRDARLRLLADDYGTLQAELERDEADEAAKARAKAALDAALAQARLRESELDADALLHAPRLAAAQETFFALSGLAERLRGTADLAAERLRHLTAPEPQRVGRDADELEGEAEVLREQEDELGERLGLVREQLARAVSQRTQAEEQVVATERRLAAEARAAAQRAERLAALRARAEAATGQAAAAEGEAGRLAEAFEQASERADRAEAELAQLQGEVSGDQDGRAGLTAAREQAQARLKEASAAVARLRAAERAASGDLAGLRARADALAEAVTSGADASAVLLARPPRFGGVLGPLATLLTVTDGAQEAIAAALGAAAGAVAVDGLDAAVAILAELRSAGAGQAGLVIAGDPAAPPADAPRLPAGLPAAATPALDLVQAPAALAGAVADLLAGVIVTDHLADGLDLLRDHPGLRVVTRDGDLLGRHWARGGSAGGQSLLSLKAAASQASAQLAAAAERGRARRGPAGRGHRGRGAGPARAGPGAGRSPGGRRGRGPGLRAAGPPGRRGQGRAGRGQPPVRRHHRRAAGAGAEPGRRDRAPGPAGRAGGRRRPGRPRGRPARTMPGEGRRAELDAAATAARAAEMEARLEVRTVEERLRAISGRADALAAAAVAEREATARAAARKELRAAAAAVARAVAEGARFALARIQASSVAADTERQHAEDASKGRDAELKAVRARLRELSGELDSVVNSAHGVQMAHATRRMQLEQIAGRVAEEFAIEVAGLLAEYGPQIPIPPAEEGQLALAYDRAEQEKRAQTAQRMLDQLGKVNPLALEEFAALEERHAFLVTQLEDLRKTRKDLLTVIKEVDDRVLQVFTSAYADTAREFERIFGLLFPGGDGRLLLTEPDDMLATGIDFEARPPGKKVKRLSLLSGGERSLTAIAFLVAIFMARPSPFYVLDEVEAALDDTNLGRLLDIFAELRRSSQLIIITHQKRTMEIADSLYGISMRGDGVSSVVSQRLRERETA